MRLFLFTSTSLSFAINCRIGGFCAMTTDSQNNFLILHYFSRLHGQSFARYILSYQKSNRKVTTIYSKILKRGYAKSPVMIRSHCNRTGMQILKSVKLYLFFYDGTAVHLDLVFFLLACS